MFYFSRIKLKSGLSLEKLADAIPKDAYAEHKAIWELFPDKEKRDFLFRRENAGQWPLFYTLSQTPPEDDKGVWSIESKPFQPQLHEGQRLAFLLRVNPVITRQVGEKKHQRDDVVMRAKLAYPEDKAPPQMELARQAGTEWLAARAEKHGFRIVSQRVEAYQQHRFFKPGEKQPIRFSTLDYQGILEVADTTNFLHALHEGIGHAKGFGCGLLLARRV